MSLEEAAKHLREIQALNQAASDKDGPRRTAENQEEYRQWATFSVAEELYAIDVMQVKEVLRYTEITPVPGANEGILGIINLRGNVVTVVSTRQMFNLPSSDVNKNTRIVVAELDNQEVIGMLVDGVDEVINLPLSDIDRAPNLVRDDNTRQFVQGVCYRDEQLIILLDLVKMLTRYMPETETEE